MCSLVCKHSSIIHQLNKLKVIFISSWTDVYNANDVSSEQFMQIWLPWTVSLWSLLITKKKESLVCSDLSHCTTTYTESWASPLFYNQLMNNIALLIKQIKQRDPTRPHDRAHLCDPFGDEAASTCAFATNSSFPQARAVPCPAPSLGLYTAPLWDAVSFSTIELPPPQASNHNPLPLCHYWQTVAEALATTSPMYATSARATPTPFEIGFWIQQIY